MAKDRGINKKTGLPNKRPGPISKLDDPEVVKYAVEKLALGFKQIRVADALGIPDSTLSDWLQISEFRKKVAERRMELADGPLNKIITQQPLVWLERTHSEFREPPKALEGSLTVNHMLSGRTLDELIDIAMAGRSTGGDNSKP